ncbi:hypothetical protein SAY86_023894 [Trapa natans]|uniref:Uncharacterized protein n=1 Tax=Trapa natans TaxID=22666 RepID=A0AAN7R669_TRANT|nr:hypothetical protein SAY86_023894 [Trapa natans]
MANGFYLRLAHFSSLPASPTRCRSQEAVAQDVPDQAEAGEEDEAEQTDTSLDSHEDR